MNSLMLMGLFVVIIMLNNKIIRLVIIRLMIRRLNKMNNNKMNNKMIMR